MRAGRVSVRGSLRGRGASPRRDAGLSAGGPALSCFSQYLVPLVSLAPFLTCCGFSHPAVALPPNIAHWWGPLKSSGISSPIVQLRKCTQLKSLAQGHS